MKDQSLHSSLVKEGESPEGNGETACSLLCRSLAAFAPGWLCSHPPWYMTILTCSTTNLLRSRRRVVCLCRDKCYARSVGFMTTPPDLLTVVKGLGFFCIHSQIKSLSPFLSRGKPVHRFHYPKGTSTGRRGMTPMGIGQCVSSLFYRISEADIWYTIKDAWIPFCCQMKVF